MLNGVNLQGDHQRGTQPASKPGNPANEGVTRPKGPKSEELPTKSGLR